MNQNIKNNLKNSHNVKKENFMFILNRSKIFYVYFKTKRKLSTKNNGH